MPSAVKQLRNERQAPLVRAQPRMTRIWTSATWRSKVRHRAAIGPRPMPNGHQPLAEQLHAVHFRLDPAAPVVPAPVSPERPAQVLRCSQDLVACAGSCRVRLPRPGIPAGRNDCCCSTGRDGIMASARVIGVASGPRPGCASAGNSAMTTAMSSFAGIWASRSGSIPRRFARTGGAHRLDIADIAGGDLERPDLQSSSGKRSPGRFPDPPPSRLWRGGSCAMSGPRHRSERHRDCAAWSRHACACAVPRAFAAPPRGHGRSAPFAFHLDAGAVRCPAGYCAAMSERRRAGEACSWSRDTGWLRPRFDGLSRRHWRHGPVSLCRRDRVLKSGTAQPGPDSSGRRATKPVVCRSGRPSRTLMARQAWIAFAGELIPRINS